MTVLYKNILMIACISGGISMDTVARITTESQLNEEVTSYFKAAIQSSPDYQELAEAKKAEHEKFSHGFESLKKERDKLFSDFEQDKIRISRIFDPLKTQIMQEEKIEREGVFESASMLKNLQREIERIKGSDVYQARVAQARAAHLVNLQAAEQACRNVDRSYPNVNTGRYEYEHLSNLRYFDPTDQIDRDMNIHSLSQVIEREKQELIPELDTMNASIWRLMRAIMEEEQSMLLAREKQHQVNIRLQVEKEKDFFSQEKAALLPFKSQMEKFHADALHTILTANEMGFLDA